MSLILEDISKLYIAKNILSLLLPLKYYVFETFMENGAFALLEPRS